MRLLLFFINVALSCVSVAQTVKLVNSSRQTWSGGIAGRHGDNYSFTIEFSHYKNEPLPDSIWVDNECFPVTCTDNDREPGNARRIRNKGKVTFIIGVGTSHDDYAHNTMPGKRDPHGYHPVTANGIAVLSYKYRDKEKYFTITKILRSLPPANYP